MENFIFLICFIIFAIFTSISILLMSYIFSYKAPDKEKSSTYECGLAPETSAKIRFNIKYFYYLIMFLLFDISTIFLYPIFATNSEYSFVNLKFIVLYLSILLFALIYFIRRFKYE